jgi:hypothetical protein
MRRFLPAKPHGKTPLSAPSVQSFGRSRELELAVAVWGQLLNELRKIKQAEAAS